jgi:DNA recombination protein RmuC
MDALRRSLAETSALQRQEQTENYNRLLETVQARLESIRQAVTGELEKVRADNAAQLEEMRKTVDEKLHETLEKRLGERFEIVSKRLEDVARGLGEMQQLATGVGDLKSLLTNVKSRGTWGEYQLGAILEQIFTPDQYAMNVRVNPKSSEVVEYAIRLPGRNDTAPVWLPIDAKFPKEDYERVQAAAEASDKEALEAGLKALERRIRDSAKDIRDKYLFPPFTTDFGILFLPTEGLYAEVLRRPGLVDDLQRLYRVNVSGPTTLMAMLNSLQMGFRTLAIEKRSSEVWQVLAAVKTEFVKFGDVFERLQKKLNEADKVIEDAGVRTRKMSRALKHVETIPELEAQVLLGDVEAEPESPADVEL